MLCGSYKYPLLPQFTIYFTTSPSTSNSTIYFWFERCVFCSLRIKKYLIKGKKERKRKSVGWLLVWSLQLDSLLVFLLPLPFLCCSRNDTGGNGKLLWYYWINCSWKSLLSAFWLGDLWRFVVHHLSSLHRNIQHKLIANCNKGSSIRIEIISLLQTATRGLPLG